MQKTLKNILIVLIIFWFVLACFRTIYNLSKLLTEEPQWIVLGDMQKREKLFGNLDPFFRFVNQHTNKHARILFLSPGGETYYLGRYYVYPRQLTYAQSPSQLAKLMSENTYNYLLMYKTSDNHMNENRSESWNLPQHMNRIAVYESSDRKAQGYLYQL